MLQWKNTKYDIFWECIYSLRYPTCRTQRFQAFSFMQTYVAQNWLLGTLLCNLLHWKTLNMTYSESVFIALGIQHAEHSGFKHSVLCKRTLQKTVCLELFYVTCCIGKTLNITYSESVFIVLGIQHVEHSGFKQSVSCKFTLHVTGSLEPVPLSYNLLQWKNTKYYIFWEWICSLRYPACKAHASYYHCPAPLYNIFNIIW